jgi:hypothetical protein
MKSLPEGPPAQIESRTLAIQVPFEPVRTDLLPNALGVCRSFGSKAARTRQMAEGTTTRAVRARRLLANARRFDEIANSVDPHQQAVHAHEIGARI